MVQTDSGHAVRAKDVQIGTNKKKFLFILRSSKTHGEESKPQLVKISKQKTKARKSHKDNKKLKLPCPFQLLRTYSKLRPHYKKDNDQFFVLSDGSNVTAAMLRNCLKESLIAEIFEPSLYLLHCLRSGRATDLSKLGLSVGTIKKLGCWKSNAVFKYLRG